MKKNRTWIVLLLIVSMTFCLLAACGQADPHEAGTETGEEKPTETQTESETHMPPPIEPRLFNTDLNVLHYTVTGSEESYTPWEEIAVEDASGDILTDDIYDRNNWLSEHYGIDVTVEYCGHEKLKEKADTAIGSGTQDFQVLDTFGFLSGRLMGQSYFLNMRQIDTIGLSNPWWNQDILDTYSIAGFVEFAASDMLFLDRGATSIMIFNQEMAEELGIEDPYSQVRQGKWTMEALAKNLELGYMDNGDGTMDGNDTWGLVAGDDLNLALFEAAGEKIVRMDEDGYFYYAFLEPDVQEVMMNVYDDIMLNPYFFNAYLERQNTVPSFDNGQALFTYGTAKVTKSLRSIELVYGLIPVPKYTEEQKEYISWVNAWHDSMFAVMANVSDPEAVGAALELMSYYSYLNIRSDFYDMVICGRGTRNAESIEMLNILFENRVYDMGITNDTEKTFADAVMRNTATGSSSFASLISSHENDINSHLDDMNALVEEYSFK